MTLNIISHSWYIKVTYISQFVPLPSQDWESMKLKVVKLIIHVTVVDWIINLTAVQFNVLNLKTHKLEVSTSMIKTNHLSWYVIVFANEMPNFTTDCELCFEFTRNLWFISSMTKSYKSHTMHLMDYDNVPLVHI